MLKPLLFFSIFHLCILFSFSQWTQTSGPIGGPAEEIFKVDDHLVLATRWGGIYKSTDDGESWNPSNSGLPVNPRIYDLFEADGTLYASIENNGIYISENKGDSWASISALIKNETPFHIFVEGNNIYGGAAYGGLLYSPDNGTTWEFKTEGANGHRFVSLHVHNSKLYAKRNNKLYETSDHGDTWREIPVPGLSPNGVSSITTHNDMLFVADESSVFYSQDTSTWTNANIPSSGGSFSLQSHEGDLYAKTNEGKYYTLSEIGQNWTLTQRLNTQSFVRSLLFLNDGIIMSSADGIHKTVDNGTTWQEKNVGINAHSVLAITANSKYVFVRAGDGIYRTNDDGQNWELTDKGFHQPFQRVDWIHNILTVTDMLFIATPKGIYSSIDHGDSWTPKFLPTSNHFLGPLAYDNGVLATTESQTGVMLSNDLGETWTLAGTEGFNIDSQVISILIKGDIIVVGTYQNEIFLSTDLGQSWSDVSIPGQFSNQRPIDLEYANDKLYVTTTQGLWVSDNLGGQWQPFIANDTQYMEDVLVIGDAVYVTTYNGVQVSTEGRNRWYPLTTGMGSKRTAKLFVRDDTMFVGTHSYGIWKGPVSEFGVSPDDDNDGVFNENDLCPNTTLGTPVNDTGCDLIAQDALRVYVTTPTCPNVANGSIEIASSISGYHYDINIIGEGRNDSFTNVLLEENLRIDDMASGMYEVTISIPDIFYEQIYGITVQEMSGISGKFHHIDTKSKSAIYVVSGSLEYNVNVNGIERKFLFDSLEENEIVLDNLDIRSNIIISGKGDCQGKFNYNLSFDKNILLYPTITSDLVSVLGKYETVDIHIYGASGQLLSTSQVQFGKDNTFNLDKHPSGLYIVHVKTEEKVNIFKIIKK